MSIEWRSDLETGISEIDSQHREWFTHVDSLLRAVDTGSAEVELLKILEFLDDYTKRHFSTEERIQQESDYPHYQIHQEEHRQFEQDLARLRDRIRENGPQARLVHLATRTLSRWLVQHISRMDKDLADFLHDHRILPKPPELSLPVLH